MHSNWESDINRVPQTHALKGALAAPSKMHNFWQHSLHAPFSLVACNDHPQSLKLGAAKPSPAPLIMAANQYNPFKMPELAGDDENQDSTRFLKAFEFHVTPIIPQYQGSTADEAKAFLLESVLPDGSTAKNWVVDQDDEVRDVWLTLKEALIERFSKKEKFNALAEALKKFDYLPHSRLARCAAEDASSHLSHVPFWSRSGKHSHIADTTYFP